LNREDLSMSVRSDARDDEHPLANDLPTLPYMLVAGIDAEVWIGRLRQRAIPPCVQLPIQLPGEFRHQALGKTRAAQRLGDRAHLAGGDALVTHVVQEILEAEMTAHLGAASDERTECRTGQRNGYKPRQLQTRVGTLTLMVPQDRAGTFSTQLFAHYQRTEKALVLSLMEMYLQGVSTRKVRAITEALCGTAFSKSQVSRLTSTLDGDLAAWRRRSLADHSYPYLVVDTRYEHVRAGGQVMTQGVLIVSGVRDDGKRAILAVDVADTESAATYMAVFRDLKARGLRGVRLVTSDDHAGLRAAIDRYFQGAGWQRCQVHYTRNLVGMVGASKRKELTAGRPLGSMRALFSATTPTQARTIAAPLDIPPLPPLSAEDAVRLDYQLLGCTPGNRHLMTFYRPQMEAWGVVTAKDLARVPYGAAVRVGGIVAIRQRPETAKGITFLTLERIA